MAKWYTELEKMGACPDAVKWAKGYKTFRNAWRYCKCGDWMLWYLGRKDADRKRLVSAACGCARLALKHVPEDEERSLKAIETAEAWTRGEATLDEVRAAAWAARAASEAARAAWEASAASEAARAAWEARAARAAWEAARAASAEILAQCADIVRKHFPRGE